MKSRFDQCLDSLYGSLTEPDRLEFAMERMQTDVGTRGATLITTTPQSTRIVASGGFPEDVRKEYEMHFVELDVMRLPVISARVGELVDGENALDPGRNRFSAYVHDFARKPRADIRHSIGLRAFSAPDQELVVSFQGGHDQKPFDDRQRRLIAQYARHVARFGLLRQGLQGQANDAAATRTVSDALQAAVFVVNPDMSVLHANGAGESLLKAATVARLSHGRLSFLDLKSSERLRAAVRAAVREPAVGGAFVHRAGPALVDRVHVRVVPAKSREAQSPGRAIIVITVGTQRLSSKSLAQLFNLTPAEAALVAHLASGLSLVHAADNQAVRVSTARTQLASVFRKVAVSTQGELLSLVLAGPGLAADV